MEDTGFSEVLAVYSVALAGVVKERVYPFLRSTPSLKPEWHWFAALLTTQIISLIAFGLQYVGALQDLGIRDIPFVHWQVSGFTALSMATGAHETIKNHRREKEVSAPGKA